MFIFLIISPYTPFSMVSEVKLALNKLLVSSYKVLANNFKYTPQSSCSTRQDYGCLESHMTPELEAASEWRLEF